METQTDTGRRRRREDIEKDNKKRNQDIERER